MSLFAEFEAISNGMPSVPFSYDKARERGITHDIFWDFFRSTPELGETMTVYSGSFGLTVSDMLQARIHSVEHVVPKGIAKGSLREQDRTQVPLPVNEGIINGSEVNPLNWLPAHSRRNNERDSLSFDYDGDLIVSNGGDDILERIAGQTVRFECGTDHQGQWVVPLVSRGDVARVVLYMLVTYRLKTYVTAEEIRVLHRWAEGDSISAYEAKLQTWMEKPKVTSVLGGTYKNPFVVNWNRFRALDVFNGLIYEATGIQPNVTINESARPIPVLAIDAVFADPRGYDVPGTEWIAIRNTRNAVTVVPELVLHIRHEGQEEQRYHLRDVTLQPHEQMKVTFPETNSLPNSGRTTIALLFNGEEIVSVSYTSVRRGQVLQLARLSG